jgi:hypothetical protein
LEGLDGLKENSRMPRRFYRRILALTCALATALFAAEAPAAQPVKERYQAAPFTAAGLTVPEVLLVVSNDLKMFQQGYPGLIDMDGRVDTGFNPGVVHVGHFDANFCYGCSGAVQKGLRSGVFMTGDKAGRFFRVGATVEDQTEAQIAVARPADLKSYVVFPRSAAGVCDNFVTAVMDGASRTFSGNWLNCLATSRMDAARKIPYGGKRGRLVAGRIRAGSGHNSEASVSYAEGKLTANSCSDDGSGSPVEIARPERATEALIFWREPLTAGFALPAGAMSLDADQAK